MLSRSCSRRLTSEVRRMIMKVDNAHTDPAAIARLESLIAELPANGRVRLIMTDGSRHEGRVSVRPAVETVRDRAGVEGINAARGAGMWRQCERRAADLGGPDRAHRTPGFRHGRRELTGRIAGAACCNPVAGPRRLKHGNECRLCRDRHRGRASVSWRITPCAGERRPAEIHRDSTPRCPRRDGRRTGPAGSYLFFTAASRG